MPHDRHIVIAVEIPAAFGVVEPDTLTAYDVDRLFVK
jgi:hypothetical protein